MDVVFIQTQFPSDLEIGEVQSEVAPGNWTGG
jgi:hypothetical protein